MDIDVKHKMRLDCTRAADGWVVYDQNTGEFITQSQATEIKAWVAAADKLSDVISMSRMVAALD